MDITLALRSLLEGQFQKRGILRTRRVTLTKVDSTLSHIYVLTRNLMYLNENKWLNT